MSLKAEFEKLIHAEYATYAAFQKPRYQKLIQRIEEIYNNQRKKESGDYRLLKRFEVCEINGEKRLIKKGCRDPVKVFVCTDELFEIIKRAHTACGHGGETRTMRELHKNYANITRDQVKAFVALCRWCRGKGYSSLHHGNQILAEEGPFIESVLCKGFSGSEPTERVDPMEQCEVLIKEEEQDGLTEFVFEDYVSVDENGSPSETVEDLEQETVGKVAINAPGFNFGIALQQLLECQRQLLMVETKRLTIEEARLKVEQQMSTNLMKILERFNKAV